MWGIELFPQMFNEELNDQIYQPVTEEELLATMKSFKRDKFPGLYGWTVEFLIHFFYLIKSDLLRMVEGTRMASSINDKISSTHIALIPKKGNAESFMDFRPISLCNISFKIISKITAERIKETLSKFLTKDQHGFLRGRNILDAVLITQEGLFAIHSKKSEDVIFKIDLHKAYDCLDYGFTRSLLAKIGIRVSMINRNMACVEKVNYAIIINEIPSSYFLVARGLRQGCPLSPLLFILAMNTLSLHINKAVKENRCRPLKICRNISISHNLSVDDIILFRMLCRLTWLCFHDILIIFQKDTGLQINRVKSIIYHNDISQETVDWLSALFGVETQSISHGIKYLSYQIKVNGYSKKDWQWILDRYYKKIFVWEYKFLSLAGRVTLA